MHAAFIFCPVLNQQDLHEKSRSRKGLVRGFQKILVVRHLGNHVCCPYNPVKGFHVLDMKEEPEQVEGYDFLD